MTQEEAIGVSKARCLKHAAERGMEIVLLGGEMYAAFDDGIDYTIYRIYPGSVTYSVRKSFRWCTCPIHEGCKHIQACMKIFGQS